MSRTPLEEPAEPRVRLLRADRRQVLLRPTDIEQLLPPDHRARGVWDFVQGLDLGAFYDEVESVEGRAGRPAIDPAILLSLWLYATVEGIGSARAVARLCDEHHAYQWICGGVSVEYRTLSDFRVKHAEKLDELLTASVGAMVHAGIVKLKLVAQDGMRVRAAAGAASFRRRSTLNGCLKDARAQVRALKRELEEDPGALSRQEAAARLRAAEDRAKRVKTALAHAERLSGKKDDDVDGPPSGRSHEGRQEAKEPRVSTTDPEARVMRFADGGYRPAYNAQLATDVGSQIIVGVDVSNSGTDYGQLAPMLEQVARRYGTTPHAALVDGGFAGLKDIDDASTVHDCDVYAPPMNRRNGKPLAMALKGDTKAVRRWRRRMDTKRGKEVYKKRGATSECVNAQARNRGLLRLTVRGIAKVRAVLLLYALGHNLLRAMNLRPAT